MVEGKIIGLTINAPNVTIKNCIMENGYYFGVDGEHGGSTLLVQNCTISLAQASKVTAVCLVQANTLGTTFPATKTAS